MIGDEASVKTCAAAGQVWSKLAGSPRAQAICTRDLSALVVIGSALAGNAHHVTVCAAPW